MDLIDNGAAGGATTNDNAGSVNDLLGGAGGGDPAAAGAAGGGDPAAAGDTGGDGGAMPDWYQQLPTDVGEGETASLLDWAKASGVKDVASLAKMARDNQRALRENGRVKVPGEGATPEEIAEYRTAIGVPEKPEDYDRPEIKGADGNPVPFNEELANRVFAKMHELGVPKAVGEALIAAEVQKQVEEYDAAIKQIEQQAAEHVKGWGADKDTKLAQVNAALKDLGFTRDDVMHMRAMPGGVGKFLDAMAKVGTNFSEDSLIKGDRRQFGMNAQQAQSELDTMKATAGMMDKINVPGSAERQRYDRLLEIVANAPLAA